MTGETGRRENPQRPANDVSFHTPSPELARWVALANQEPDVRSDVLARVADNLATGVYLTQASAEQTAHAMIQASE